jgi:hypothetical protein
VCVSCVGLICYCKMGWTRGEWSEVGTGQFIGGHAVTQIMRVASEEDRERHAKACKLCWCWCVCIIGSIAIGVGGGMIGSLAMNTNLHC